MTDRANCGLINIKELHGTTRVMLREVSDEASRNSGGKAGRQLSPAGGQGTPNSDLARASKLEASLEKRGLKR